MQSSSVEVTINDEGGIGMSHCRHTEDRLPLRCACAVFGRGVSRGKKLAKRILEDFVVKEGRQFYEAEGFFKRLRGLPWKNGTNGNGKQAGIPGKTFILVMTAKWYLYCCKGYHIQASQHRGCSLSLGVETRKTCMQAARL